MKRIITYAAYWLFQVINTITASMMTFLPKRFHEGLFNNPEMVYEKLGFSVIAVEMVHNIIRGHGAVLLAVSIFIWIEGMKSRAVYLLIALVCALSVYAHIMTLHHHLRTTEVAAAIGDFGSLYMTILITAVVGILNLVVYLNWNKWALRGE